MQQTTVLHNYYSNSIDNSSKSLSSLNMKYSMVGWASYVLYLYFPEKHSKKGLQFRQTYKIHLRGIKTTDKT